MYQTAHRQSTRNYSEKKAHEYYTRERGLKSASQQSDQHVEHGELEKQDVLVEYIAEMDQREKKRFRGN